MKHKEEEMKWDDLRGYIRAVEVEGELLKVDGAHWDLEIGAITELIAERHGPALLFDNIVDYPRGYRVFSNGFATLKRTAMVLGLPTDLKGLELIKAWREKLRGFKPVPPVEVQDGPVKQNIKTGSDVNLFEFPTPKWHELDGGRYLGTGSVVITRDPEEGWVNAGTYRCMIHGKNKISVKLNKGKHGRFMMEKYHAKGQPCPIAISFGHDPCLWEPASDSGIQWGESEYDFACWLRGEPIAVTRGVVTDLPIPATAEIVIEGEIPPIRDIQPTTEGPFGEWDGYYADTTTGVVPVMTVKSMLYRDKPIILGQPTFKPPIPYHFAIPLLAAQIWESLERAGISGVTGVWIPGNCDMPLMIFISIQQSYPGHAKQVALAATSCRAGTQCNRLVVIVDSDVDITNTDEVLWAITTRCEPETIDIVRDMYVGYSSPLLSEEKRVIEDTTGSRLIINACRPAPWSRKFPSVCVVSSEYRDKVLKKWPKLFS